MRKAIDAIESRSSDAFLTMVNKAAWLVGFTEQRLGWFLFFFEQVLGYESLEQREAGIRQRFSSPGAGGYLVRLLLKLYRPQNELVETAGLLLSVDRTVALSLLALDDLIDESVLVTTRQIVGFSIQVIAGNDQAADIGAVRWRIDASGDYRR